MMKCARDGDARFHVVVPATPVAHGLTWNEDEARAAAGARLDEVLTRLRGLGLEASGEVGSQDPVAAVGDALRRPRAIPPSRGSSRPREGGTLETWVWLDVEGPDSVVRARLVAGEPG